MAMDLTGDVYGRLTVLSESKKRGRKGKRYWDCRCTCGRLQTVGHSSLRCGDTISCGCYRIERVVLASKTHGMTKSDEYTIWKGMRRRCHKETDKNYENYGGRGVLVCEEWHSFEQFLADMGNRPSKRHSIERRNNDGHYEPSNCYWAKTREQHRNHRGNVMLTYQGRTQTRTDWADELGLKRMTLRSRLRDGWPIERALTKPVRPWGR